ncbi:MAG: hypothetical protein ACHQCE_03595 [Streptosporangiales bacterium]
MSGPFSTEAEARKAALAAAGPPRSGWSILAEDQRRELLMDACADAGVTLGEYDSRILRWVAGWEDATVAVIAGLITRAGERPAACRPMDTDDLDPETGEEAGIEADSAV